MFAVLIKVVIELFHLDCSFSLGIHIIKEEIRPFMIQRTPIHKAMRNIIISILVIIGAAPTKVDALKEILKLSIIFKVEHFLKQKGWARFIV
jgi:hypothetical protein